MIVALYKSKAAMRQSVGKPLKHQETSIMGPEYKPTGNLVFVGPGAYNRKFYGTVTLENGLIKSVR